MFDGRLQTSGHADRFGGHWINDLNTTVIACNTSKFKHQVVIRGPAAYLCIFGSFEKTRGLEVDEFSGAGGIFIHLHTCFSPCILLVPNVDKALVGRPLNLAEVFRFDIVFSHLGHIGKIGAGGVDPIMVFGFVAPDNECRLASIWRE